MEWMIIAQSPMTAPTHVLMAEALRFKPDRQNQSIRTRSRTRL